MNIEVLEKSTFPGTLVRQWEELLSNSRWQNPFLTPTWNEIWLKHFGKSLPAKLLLFRDQGQTLVALGVFSNSTDERGRQGLTLLGSSDVCDYRDLVVASRREKEAFHALVRFFADGSWDFLELPGVSEFSPTMQFLPPLLESSGFRVVLEVEEISVFLNLPPTWDEFLEKLEAKDRHELRRKMRRLEKEAAFEIWRVEDAPSLFRGMEIFFELHRKSRRDKAQFMTPQMQAYFQEISLRFQEKSWLNLSFLKIAGKEVATFFSFDFAGIEYVYNSGYDPQFARFSPGIVLAAHCLRGAIEKQRVGFNLLRGKERYKYHLGGKAERIYRIQVWKQ
ncbi:MAG: GNAT family N-acetyltransferase [Deltaproteobacteria bacterium]|nr:GNAT family N-acetyltransferase [Deltaproteobacteria bacterium]